MVEYIGYGGGRGEPYEWLLWASAGYAHLVMDTRGQGGTWQGGDTSDIDESGTGSQAPGVMSRGILDPATYYYRRLMTDAVLAVDAARDMPIVDASRIAVIGGSQGGGLALTVAGLAEGLAGAIVDVPFLTHFRRALEVTDENPYGEIAPVPPDPSPRGGAVFRTLSYFDGATSPPARRCRRCSRSGWRTTSRRRRRCSPRTTSTPGPKEIRVWPFNGHEAPSHEHTVDRLAFAARSCSELRWAAADTRMRAASRSAIALMIALVVAGCWGGERLQGPTLAIRNDTAEPVVVRVQRSKWEVPASGSGYLGALSFMPAASVEILDPTTCARLDTVAITFPAGHGSGVDGAGVRGGIVEGNDDR